MAASFEKSVKGATKIKLAAPKTKYIEHILQATHTGEAGVGEIFRSLQFRLRDSTWTIAFKALIVVHFMIRDGEPNAALQYLSQSPQKLLSVNQYSDMQTQGKNIRRYSKYLMERAKAFALTKQDHIAAGPTRMRKLTVDKGLLRETEICQAQIAALVKCDFFSDSHENEICLTAFRLLVQDASDLFKVVNEAVINVIEHFFEMPKSDAERALGIYKRFCNNMNACDKFFGIARNFEHYTRVSIGNVRHAPITLLASLEEYVKDPDFETHRRQFVLEQEAKRSGKKAPPTSAPTTTSTPAKSSGAPTNAAPRGPPADLIDFFDTIEDKQQTLGQQPQQFQQAPMYGGQFVPQQTGFMQTQPTYQQPNPYGQMPQQPNQFQPQPQSAQLNPQFTGAGFGGFTPQPQSQQQPQMMPMQTGIGMQNGMNSFGQQPPPQQQQSPPPFIQQQQTGTNPFRQSMMPTGGNQFGQQQSPVQQQSPQHLTASQTGRNPFSHGTQGFQSSLAPIPQNQPAPLLAQATGTNPFARQDTSNQQSQQPGVLLSQATGSTNPFRQSQFVNQQTGQGWQQGPQYTMGGLEQLQTTPVFPRPGQPQQQQQQSPWG